MAPRPRPRVSKSFEQLELALRGLSLTLEVVTLGIFIYLGISFWYDHAINPVALAGVVVATVTDLAEVYTLSILERGWPQARIGLIVSGDVIGAILLFFSWTWLITRGMFWSCVYYYPEDEALLYGNCGGLEMPSEHVQKLSWVLPFTLAGMHLIIVAVYCSAMRRRPG